MRTRAFRWRPAPRTRLLPDPRLRLPRRSWITCTTEASAPIRRVQTYVEVQLGEIRTLGELADVAGLSRYHFARRFREEVGEPPWAYVRRKRAEEARRLLEDGRRPAEVAHETGYADQSHLTRDLRERLGRTPGEIRRSPTRTARTFKTRSPSRGDPGREPALDLMPETEEAPDPVVVAPPVPRRVENALFDSRTVIISGGIDQDLAGSVIARLTALAASSDDPITVILNSPGGHVESGDTIHDMIRFVRPRVRMLGTGWVASAGALIYVAVPREDRFCLPNTRFLLHEPSGGVRGPGSDIQIEAQQILEMRDRLTRIFARETGQSVERVREDTRRNFWLDAEGAVEYGLAGRIVQSAEEMT